MLTDVYFGAVILPSLTLSVAHFFPWGALPGRHGEPLPRLITKAIGTLAIVGWPSLLALRYAATAWDVLVLLWIVSASAGATTLVAWAVTDSINAHAEARAGQISTEAARTNGRD